MSIKLLTGYTNETITADDDKDIYTAIYGNSNFVLPVGKNLPITIQTGTLTVAIGAGAFCFSGRIGRISSSVSKSISLPESGFFKKAVVSIRYTKNASTQVEDVDIAISYSDPAASAAAAGALETTLGSASITDSTTSADFPLYSFILSAGDYSDLATLFTVAKTLQELNGLVANEAAARLNANSTLHSNIVDESLAREAADDALSEQIDGAAATLETAYTSAANRLTALERKTAIYTGNAVEATDITLNVGSYLFLIAVIKHGSSLFPFPLPSAEGNYLLRSEKIESGTEKPAISALNIYRGSFTFSGGAVMNKSTSTPSLQAMYGIG